MKACGHEGTGRLYLSHHWTGDVLTKVEVCKECRAPLGYHDMKGVNPLITASMYEQVMGNSDMSDPAQSLRESAARLNSLGATIDAPDGLKEDLASVIAVIAAMVSCLERLADTGTLPRIGE